MGGTSNLRRRARLDVDEGLRVGDTGSSPGVTLISRDDDDNLRDLCILKNDPQHHPMVSENVSPVNISHDFFCANKNKMSLSTEVSDTVLDCARVYISTADLITGFPIYAPDGFATVPSYTFASSLTSGLFRQSGSGDVSVSVDGDVVWSASVRGNVALGSVTDYGGADVEGVLYLPEVVTTPVGTLNSGSGGVLYVTGNDVVFMDWTSGSTLLTSASTSNVTGPDACTDEEVAVFADTTGHIVTTSGVVYTGTGSLRVGAGGYTFVSAPTTGMYLHNTTDVTWNVAGGDVMSVSPDAITCFHGVRADAGSAAFPTYTFASDVTCGLFEVGSVGVGVVAGVVTTGVLVGDNTVLGGPVYSGFGGGSGVVKMSAAIIEPVGIPNGGGGGGVLYLTGAGEQLRWLNASGDDVRLNGVVNIVPSGSSVPNSVCVWTDVVGQSVGVSRGVVTDAGAIRARSGSLYSFQTDTTTGMTASSVNGVQLISGGVPIVNMTPLSVTLTRACEFQGGGGGPGMSFTADVNTVVGLPSTATMRVSVTSTTCTEFHGDTNVVSCGSGNAFAGGVGCWGVENAVTPPSTSAVDGGFLYVDGTNLMWRDASNTEVTVTSSLVVASPTSSVTPYSVVRYDGTTGFSVKDSLVSVGDATLQVVEDEGYRFTSDPTSGCVSPSGSSNFEVVSGGVTGLTVSSTGIEVAHVLHTSDGSVSTPAYSFTAYPTSGLYRAGVHTLELGASGVKGMSVSSNGNVACGAEATPDFAGGQGVVYLSEVTTPPTTTFLRGGILYVSGRNLLLHDASGTTSQLSGVQHAGASTNDALVRFSDTAGRSIVDTSGFTLTDGGQVLAPSGTPGAPSYTLFDGGNAGMCLLSPGSLSLGNSGASQLTVSATSVVALAPLTCVDGIRVGTVNDMTATVSGTTAVRSLGDGSNVFAWQQNGTGIMETTVARELVVTAVQWSGSTGDLIVQKNGSVFELVCENVADSLVFRVGGSDGLSVATGSCTMQNLEISTERVSCSGIYGFTASPSSGIDSNSLVVNGSLAINGGTSTNMKFFTSNASSNPGSRVLTIAQAASAPTSLPSSGAYMYVTGSGEFLRVATAYNNVVVNGPCAYASFTCSSVAVNSGSDTLVTPLVDVDSHIFIVSGSTVTGTVHTSGWWEVSVQADWVANATGYRRVRIEIDGTEVGAATQNAVSVGGVNTQQQVTACVNVAASAVLSVYVEQTSGGILNVDVVGTAVFLG